MITIRNKITDDGDDDGTGGNNSIKRSVGIS